MCAIAGRPQVRRGAADPAGVSPGEITDAEYVLVAAVAAREGWDDLAAPPADPVLPRTVAEQAAVLRFAAALPPAPTSRGWNPAHARALMVVLVAAGLVACWLVSPERTALGLLFAGLFCLVALRRRARRGGAVPMPVAAPGGIAGALRRGGAARPF